RESGNPALLSPADSGSPLSRGRTERSSVAQAPLSLIPAHSTHATGTRVRYDARQPPRRSMYSATIASSRYVFGDLKTLLAKASPPRSGDQLAGIAAASGEERVAAQYALADVPLASILEQPVIPYESDEVTRLIVDSHDRAAFGEIAHLTVGGLRDWLLSDA